MKTIKATQQVLVQINKEEQRQIALDYLSERFELDPKYHYIDNGKLMKITTYHTSHSWNEHEVVRNATELDKAVLTVLTKIRLP